MRSINLMVGAWQKGQITWISDLWLVVAILIDLAASLIYVTSIYIYNLFIYTHTHTHQIVDSELNDIIYFIVSCSVIHS